MYRRSLLGGCAALLAFSGQAQDHASRLQEARGHLQRSFDAAQKALRPDPVDPFGGMGNAMQRWRDKAARAKQIAREAGKDIDVEAPAALVQDHPADTHRKHHQRVLQEIDRTINELQRGR